MKKFESAHLMKPNKVFNEYHVYYIEAYSTKFNDIELTHLYLADKRIKIDEYTKLIHNDDNCVIFEFNYDGTPRQLKGFKTKEIAQLALETRKNR
jgi:hypothetical protein